MVSVSSNVLTSQEQTYWEALVQAGFDKGAMKYDRAQSSGKGFQGCTEKIAILLTHHKEVMQETNAEKGFLRDVEMLTSRLADREMDVGCKVHLMDGYYVVDKQFVGGGAFITLLQGVCENQLPKIICRGTAMRRSATGGYMSGINDLSEQIGQLGVQTIWQELKKYLDERKITHVEVLGKSLGGGHAQALTVLLEGHGVAVEHAITVASVGLAQEINDIFTKVILPTRKTPMRITVIRNGGPSKQDEVDYIPLLGGAHIGAGATSDRVQVAVYYLASEHQEIDTRQTNLSLFRMGIKLFRSFKKAHIRQNTWEEFSWKKIETAQALEVQLKLGQTLESYRVAIARLLSHVLPRSLQHKPFKEYFFSY